MGIWVNLNSIFKFKNIEAGDMTGQVPGTGVGARPNLSSRSLVRIVANRITSKEFAGIRKKFKMTL